MQEPNTPKLALVMVGLPARGKTFIGRKLARYLCWLGQPTRVFNVGSYRRAHLGSQQRHDFFDPGNPAGEERRRHVATLALEDMIGWLRGGGEVGIYDATNSTHERRRFVQERCEREGLRVMFIESICNDPALIEANVRETKLHSPDYAGVDPTAAVRDFRARIAHYETVYETLDDDDQSFIKLIDVGRRVVVNRLQGYLPARLVIFLMNLHITPRPIWLTRHGESLFNLQNRIGGDARLSPRGIEYGRALAAFARERSPSGLVVWTSTLARTIDTAAEVVGPKLAWRALDEIDAGVCDGLSYQQIAEQMPEEYAARASDKFHYRYPRGESYGDVIQRLDPVIIELERQRSPLMIVGHQAVLRALYAYLTDTPAEDCPRVSVPLHTVIELMPNAYGCDERRIDVDPRGIVEEVSSS